MLQTVEPFEFTGRTPTGKTRPAFAVATDADGNNVDVVLKLSFSSERGISGMAMEAVVACLAGDLGLPVPQPYIARLTPQFIDATASVDPEWATLASRSCRRTFASKRVPDGFTTWVSGGKIPPTSQVAAASILLLDAVSKNADRRPENPNLLVRGDEFRIIDHELCFPTFLLTLGNAWEIGGLQGMATVDWHILRDGLQGQNIDWSATVGSWQALSDDMIDAYATCLPQEWEEAQPAIAPALDRIKQARDNAADCAAEVQRIIKC